MLIGELCQKAGVTKETVRHYESLGLIRHATRTAGSRTYREYDEQTLERLAMIEKGKAAMFTLREMKPILELFLANKMSKAKQRQLVAKKLEEVEGKIREAEKVRKMLREKLDALG